MCAQCVTCFLQLELIFACQPPQSDGIFQINLPWELYSSYVNTSASLLSPSASLPPAIDSDCRLFPLVLFHLETLRRKRPIQAGRAPIHLERFRAAVSKRRGDMVGIFSRFSGSHRRAQSAAADVREPLPSNVEEGGSTSTVPDHGFEISYEFKPVEHPTEPINRDQPVRCPLPEPSILNDGRIWKERMTSVSSRARADLPVVKEGSQLDTEAGGMKPRSVPVNRQILPSYSAPEHNLIDLLEECSASGSQPVA